MAVIEASSMGCLILTWDIRTGITELVKQGTNGFFVPYCDFPQMALKALEAIEKYDSLSQEAIRYSRDIYSLQRMREAYEQLFLRALAMPAARRSHVEQALPVFHARRKYSSLLPSWVRRSLVSYIRRSPTLHLLARNLRRI
jgi:hypothetical protein